MFGDLRNATRIIFRCVTPKLRIFKCRPISLQTIQKRRSLQMILPRQHAVKSKQTYSGVGSDMEIEFMYVF